MVLQLVANQPAGNRCASSILALSAIYDAGMV